MDFEAKMYDAEGKEVELKPGHVMMIGKESFMQVPIDDYSAEFIFKEGIKAWDERYEKAKDLICEWGTVGMGPLFPCSDGTFKKWEDLNEEVSASDS